MVLCSTCYCGCPAVTSYVLLFCRKDPKMGHQLCHQQSSPIRKWIEVVELKLWAGWLALYMCNLHLFSMQWYTNSTACIMSYITSGMYVGHCGASLSQCMCSCMHMAVIRMWLSIKSQATVQCIWNNIYRHVQHRKWVRLASPVGMSCPVCMVAACTQV